GLAWAFQGRDEFLNRFRSNEIAFRTVILDEGAGAFRAAVIDGDGIAIAGKVTSEVAAHNCQTDNTNVCFISRLTHVRYLTHTFDLWAEAVTRRSPRRG